MSSISASPHAPPAWSNQEIVLYHGTIGPHALSIRRSISLSHARPRTDFGAGFYTTTSLIQAKSWAWNVAAIGGHSSSAARVVEFTVDREALGRLLTLAFVRGDWHAGDYWSLVFHCRCGLPGHGRGAKQDEFYDVVYGPVAAFWQQRSAMHDSDQISFHTAPAIQLLNRSKRKRILRL